VSISIQIRVVVVMRNAFALDTLSRSAPCQRKYVSDNDDPRQHDQTMLLNASRRHTDLINTAQFV
ncbi:MAG: hypothetical protein ACJ72H_09395, partial [Candidatus Sulfotelmatobacter sp.]